MDRWRLMPPAAGWHVVDGTLSRPIYTPATELDCPPRGLTSARSFGRPLTAACLLAQHEELCLPFASQQGTAVRMAPAVVCSRVIRLEGGSRHRQTPALLQSSQPRVSPCQAVAVMLMFARRTHGIRYPNGGQGLANVRGHGLNLQPAAAPQSSSKPTPAPSHHATGLPSRQEDAG